MKKSGEKYKAKNTTIVNGVGVKYDTIVTIDAVFKSGTITYEVENTGIILSTYDEWSFDENFEKMDE